MRFFVDPSRRLVRTHESKHGYPFHSNNWMQVSSEEYDAFSRETREEFTKEELRQVRVEGYRLTQVYLEKDEGWFLLRRGDSLNIAEQFRSQTAAREYAATHKIIILRKPQWLTQSPNPLQTYHMLTAAVARRWVEDPIVTLQRTSTALSH